jgi:hypothetical protein
VSADLTKKPEEPQPEEDCCHVYDVEILATLRKIEDSLETIRIRVFGMLVVISLFGGCAMSAIGSSAH